MDQEPGAGNPVEQLLRRQGRAARSRDTLRRTATLAAWPMAVAGSVLISTFGSASSLNLWASWILLMAAAVVLIASFIWVAARMLSSRIPPLTASVRVSRRGAWAALGVASIAAGLLASSAPLTALIFWAVAVFALVILWIRERELDGRVEQIGHEVMVLVGYR